MGLPNNATIRRMVKGYRKFFNHMDRRKSVAALAKNISTASQLHLAVMASICGSITLSRLPLSGAKVTVFELENNPVYQDFVKYGAQNHFG